MKRAYVQVERVCDCPEYNMGICEHIEMQDSVCDPDYTAYPPKHCPLEDI